jgi:hypothetical protein
MADTIQPGNSFALQVEAWAKKAKGSIDANTRAITLALFSGIIKATPVDAGGDIAGHVGGRARGNWQTSVGTPATGTVDSLDASGANAIGQISANMGGAGKVTWLTNNLPYIAVLEFGLYPNPPKHGTRLKGGGYEIRSIGGYSRQAPAGMIRINMARIGEIIRNAKV